MEFSGKLYLLLLVLALSGPSFDAAVAPGKVLLVGLHGFDELCLLGDTCIGYLSVWREVRIVLLLNTHSFHHPSNLALGLRVGTKLAL